MTGTKITAFQCNLFDYINIKKTLFCILFLFYFWKISCLFSTITIGDNVIIILLLFYNIHLSNLKKEEKTTSELTLFWLINNCTDKCK